jgi:hypothetical protein
MKKEMAQAVVTEMEKLETKLRSLGTTDKQIDKILNYGRIHISILNTAITSPGLRHVMKQTFGIEDYIDL